MRETGSKWVQFAIGIFSASYLCIGQAAVTYNLTNDFSDSNNPNGAWSYLSGSTLLPHQSSALNNGNPFRPAIPSGGYFAFGNDLNQDTPFVVKTAVNGSVTGTDNLAGDVLVHSPNGSTPLYIVWTAPSAGTIDFAGSIWYAHSPLQRSNEVALLLNNVQVGSNAATISYLSYASRSTPWSFNGTNLAVGAGDQLAVRFLQTSGQIAGSLNGIGLNVDFTASSTGSIPGPATLGLLAVGACLFGLGRRRA